MADKSRLFIAVHLSDQVMTGLADLQANLKANLDPNAPIRWVAAHNIHMTLQFLGDVDAGLIPKLAGSLNGGYVDLEPFEVDLVGLGAFPKPNRPKVIWVGLRRGTDGLRALHAATLRVTEELGFEAEDRPFKAHVTLGRIRSGRGRRTRPPDLSAPISRLSEAEAGKCQITQVHLVQSKLQPGGPLYTTLDSFPVGG